MSAAESNIPIPRRPKNVIWLKTYYYTIPGNVLEYEISQSAHTPLMKFDFVEDYFSFQFARMTENLYGAFAVRFPTVTSVVDDGYELQFHFTIIGSNEDMKTANLPAAEQYAGVYFLKECFKEKFSSPDKYDDYHFDVKVIVNMLEYENLSNKNREDQEQYFVSVMKKAIKSEVQVRLMCRILQVFNLKDIFTGRQDIEWAAAKTTIIFRTVYVASTLNSYLDMRRKVSTMLSPEKDRRVAHAVNLIFNDRDEEISDDLILVAYITAYTYGLDYVKTATRDLAFRRHSKMMLVARMALAADRFGDSVFLRLIASPLRHYLPMIQQEQFWIDMVENTGYLARSLVHSLIIKEKMYELQLSKSIFPPSTATEVPKTMSS